MNKPLRFRVFGRIAPLAVVVWGGCGSSGVFDEWKASVFLGSDYPSEVQSDYDGDAHYREYWFNIHRDMEVDAIRYEEYLRMDFDGCSQGFSEWEYAGHIDFVDVNGETVEEPNHPSKWSHFRVVVGDLAIDRLCELEDGVLDCGSDMVFSRGYYNADEDSPRAEQTCED